MTELKCPFCQQELKELYSNGFVLGLRCKNKDCCKTNMILCGTASLWQALIDTKKKLDIAIDELEDCEEWFGGSKLEKHFMLERIYKAYNDIEQIDRKESK